jgi:phage terminase small subunit
VSLTPQQLRFCSEYVIDLNAGRAYKASGYKVKSDSVAWVNAARLLRNAKVKARIAELQASRAQRTQITADRVLQEIGRIAFSDITDVATFAEQGVEFKSSNELTKDVTAAILEVSSDVTYSRGRGEDADAEPEPTVKRRIKMHNKIEALKLAAQHLGLTSDFNQAVATLASYGIHLRQTENGWTVENSNSNGQNTTSTES